MKSKFIFLFIASFLFSTSCNKEEIPLLNSPISNLSDSGKDGKTGKLDYDFDDLEKIDKIKVRFSKILATAISKKPELKKNAFGSIFLKALLMPQMKFSWSTYSMAIKRPCRERNL